MSSDTVVVKNLAWTRQGLRIAHKNEEVWTLKEADVAYSFIRLTEKLLLFVIRRREDKHVEVYDLNNHSRLMSHAVMNPRDIKCDGSYILVLQDELDIINIADKSSFSVPSEKFKTFETSNFLHFSFPHILMMDNLSYVDDEQDELLDSLSEVEAELKVYDIDDRNRVIHERFKFPRPTYYDNLITTVGVLHCAPSI